MRIFLLLFIFLLNSCSSTNIEDRQNFLLELNDNQFEDNIYRLNSFNIFSLKKVKNDDVLKVYIEGDGLAWLDRFTPSMDPTPNNPLGFKLAIEDKSDNVIYLSRPCQYVSNSNCNQSIWTNLQYSATVLRSYENILSELSKTYKEIHLIGYSGGAAITIYLASLEGLNIKSIRTVAGNINPDEIIQLLKLSAYQKTINFYSLEDKIRNLPQTHYYGVKDKVVPIKLHLNYAERNLSNKCTKIQSVPASHSKGWVEFWKKNYQLNFNC